MSLQSTTLENVWCYFRLCVVQQFAKLSCLRFQVDSFFLFGFEDVHIISIYCLVVLVLDLAGGPGCLERWKSGKVRRSVDCAYWDKISPGRRHPGSHRLRGSLRSGDTSAKRMH